MVPVLHDALTRHHIRLTDEGELFLRLYCAVSVRRISEGYPLPEFHAEDVAENVREAAKDIAVTIQQLADKALSPSEESWLCVHIAARQIQEIAPVPSMPMTTKRWSITSCATSIPTITTTCSATSNCMRICSPTSKP